MYPVDVEGLGAGISFVPAGSFSGPKLLLNGAPAPKGDGRNTFKVPDANGATVQVKLHPGLANASLEHAGKKTKLGPEIPTWLVVIAALPMGLIAVGGLIGGACGGGAFAVNLGIARGGQSVAIKVVMMLAVAGVAATLFFVGAGLLQGALGS